MDKSQNKERHYAMVLPKPNRRIAVGFFVKESGGAQMVDMVLIPKYGDEQYVGAIHFGYLGEERTSKKGNKYRLLHDARTTAYYGDDPPNAAMLISMCSQKTLYKRLNVMEAVLTSDVRLPPWVGKDWLERVYKALNEIAVANRGHEDKES